MKILYHHLSNNLLRPLLFLILTFSLLFIIADLMNIGEDFHKYKTSKKNILQYYIWQLPSMLINTIPISILLATLYSLGNLARNSEITAMKASGIGISTLIQPYLLISLFFTILTAIISEWVRPNYSYRAYQLIQKEHVSEKKPFLENIPYRNPEIGHTWFIQKMDSRAYILHGVTFSQNRQDGSDLQKITAKKVYWLDQKWWFEDGIIQKYNNQNNLVGKSKTFQIKEMSMLPEIPEDFLGEAKNASHLSANGLYNYIKTHQFLSSETIAGYEVDFHHKLAMPFNCILAFLLAMPIGNNIGRQNAVKGILVTLTLFLSFYGTQFTTEYLARIEIISPWVGCWIPLFIFVFIGYKMIRTIN